MELFILLSVCFGAWAATLALVMWLMRESESAFVLGALLGVLSAAAAGGVYYQFLDRCSLCP